MREVEAATDRVWVASPNGDWWSAGSDTGSHVYILKESDLPADLDSEELEGDKFEDLIMELGTKVQIPVIKQL
jgi:hypothetical protein